MTPGDEMDAIDRLLAERDHILDALKELASYFDEQAAAYRRHTGDYGALALHGVTCRVVAEAYEHAATMVRAYQK